MTRPRVIRKVSRLDKSGKVKVVKDLREQISIEKVKAKTRRRCQSLTCPFRNDIRPTEIYYRVTNIKRTSFHNYPLTLDFHFTC
jgi:hypothetical protein